MVETGRVSEHSILALRMGCSVPAIRLFFGSASSPQAASFDNRLGAESGADLVHGPFHFRELGFVLDAAGGKQIGQIRLTCMTQAVDPNADQAELPAALWRDLFLDQRLGCAIDLL